MPVVHWAWCIYVFMYFFFSAFSYIYAHDEYHYENENRENLKRSSSIIKTISLVEHYERKSVGEL